MSRFRILSVVAALFVVSLGMSQVPDFTGITICFDPGHGGHEGDDRPMPNGFWESESNFTKATWLEALLMDRGCNVVLTRYGNDDDVADDPSLSERPAVAIANDADLFISIHSNAANAQVNYPLPIFNGKSESPTNPEAKEYCQTLLDNLMVNQATHWTRYGRIVGDLTLNPNFSTGYGVLVPLIGKDLPGIISEGSFHDYKPENDRLLNLDYRRQEAYHMYYSLVEHFGLEGRETLGNISGIVRDTLLPKSTFTDMTSPDAYENVNGALVSLMETGETYQVDSLNTGFYMFDSITPGSYHLIFSAHGYMTDTVTIDVEAHSFSYHNHWMEVDRSIPPKLTKFSVNEGEVLPCFSPVSFSFSVYMDSASCAESFSIVPALDGSFSWDKDYLTMSFQPELPYEVSSQYTVTLGAGSEHMWGVAMGKDTSFTFTTGDRNRYSISKSFPSDQQNDISTLAQVRLIFDAPLYTNSLVGAVSIEAGDGTILTPTGAETQTVDGQGHYYFTPSEELLPETSYTVHISGSVQDEDKIPLVDQVDISFTTGTLPGESTVVDELEDLETWSVDMENSTGIASSTSIYRWYRDYISGDAALLLRYSFLAQNGSTILSRVGPQYLYHSLDEIGMWIYGDLSGHSIILELDNDLEVMLCQLDFAGWDYKTVALPSGAGHIQSIRLDQNNDGPASGSINYDMLSQPGNATGISQTRSLEGLSIYPNPVENGSVRVNGLNSNASFAIYSLNGSLLQKGVLKDKSSLVSLEAAVRKLPVVLLKIETAQGIHTQLLTIKQ